VTSPRLAVDSRFGRLYRHPQYTGETELGPEDSLAAGFLVPSVTNVIGCLDKPFLTSWYGKLAAEDAVETARKHPGLLESRPRAAVDWLKTAGNRRLEAAAALGDAVHAAAEALSLGEDIDISDEVAPYIDSWKRFVDDFQPEFLHVESTCFGGVEDPIVGPLGYAGTTDFIARINGVVVVGDYKSGRSIHSDAALQLSALANAKELVLNDESLTPLPDIESGLVVHLTPKGYAVRQSDVTGLSWHIFSALRKVWDYHVANLESRGPLLMSNPVKSASGVVARPTTRSAPLASGILLPSDSSGL